MLEGGGGRDHQGAEGGTDQGAHKKGYRLSCGQMKQMDLIPFVFCGHMFTLILMHTLI